MAFSKMAGLEVTPRRDSSRTSRSSSPCSIRERRIWSSHGEVPASSSAARRSLVCAAVAIRLRPFAQSVYELPARGGHVLRGEAEVLQQGRGGPRRAEAGHTDHLAVVADDAVPAQGGGGLHGHARAHGGRQHRVAVALVLLHEAGAAG